MGAKEKRKVKGKSGWKGTWGFIQKWAFCQNTQGHKGKYQAICFLCAAFLMFLFFYAGSVNAFVGETAEKKFAKELPLGNGQTVEQEFSGGDRAMMGIALRFRVYETSAPGNLNVRLYEDGQLLEEWSLQTAGLEQDAYHSFPLGALIKTQADVSYKLAVTGAWEGDKGIALCLAADKSGGCYENGVSLGRYSLCFYLTYVRVALKMWVRILAAILFLLTALAALWKVSEKMVMSGLLVAFGAIYCWLCPPGMAPDEDHHFCRAFEISCGEWTSQHIGEDGEGGNYLPAAVRSFRDPAAEIDWDDIAEMRYGNTSLYSPVSYLPQAIGIRIARLCTDNVAMIFYGGKLGSLLAGLLLCLWAIQSMPFGRRILFLIMLFPMTLQEMVSMSPDGFTIALSLAFVAKILQLRCQEGTLGKKDWAAVAMLGMLLALCKVVYVALLFLTLLLPGSKMGEKKKARAFQWGIPMAGLAINLAWLKISAGYLVEFRPGVSSGDQVRFILLHFKDYVTAVIRTVCAWFTDWVENMIGSQMGALNIEISHIVWLAFLLLFLYEIYSCNDAIIPERRLDCHKDAVVSVRRLDCLVLGGVFLGGAALICTSIYVQWNAVASLMVEGIQGRYFTPLLPCLALLMLFLNQGNGEIYLGKRREGIGRSYAYMILLVLHGITILDVIKHYI